MAEIVNLRRVRKAKARGESEKEAADNRLHFGTPKRLRVAAGTDAAKDARRHASHKLDRDTNGTE